MKVQRSISLDKELDDFLKERPTWNASAIINELLRQWIKENQKE